jgi:vacuolar-type H+-ATPase subunit I/STV1
MKAAQELEKLNQAERDLAARREQLTAALKEATATRAGEILDSAIAGKEPGVPDSRVASLQADLAAVSEALELLAKKRKDTERRAGYERAEELRKEAGEAKKVAEEHAEKVRSLLAQLKELEGGTDYEPSIRIGNPRPKSAKLREEVGELNRKTHTLQRELDLVPLREAEARREEERFAAVDLSQPWQAMREAQESFVAGTREDEDDDLADDTLH